MLKRVSVEVAGSDASPKQDLVITPETTAQELLTRAGLTNYQLCPSPNQLPFGKHEQVFEKVPENAVLFAYRHADAGGVIDHP